MKISFLSSDSILKKNNSDAAKQSLSLSLSLRVSAYVWIQLHEGILERCRPQQGMADLLIISSFIAGVTSYKLHRFLEANLKLLERVEKWNQSVSS